MPSTARRRRRARVAALVTLTSITGSGIVGCGNGDDGDAPATTTPATATAAALSELADIAAMQRGLTSAGITCELEYESLHDEGKELSLCVIEGDRATLTIWAEPEVLEDFLASPDAGAGVTVVGANWTVDLQHRPVAESVAAALGGTVKGG